MTWSLYTTCVQSTAELIDAMTEHPENEELDYRRFAALVGREALVAAFPDYDWRLRPTRLTMAKDWAVSFHRSVFGLGRDAGPCAYVVHSAIEHVFLPDTHPLMRGMAPLAA